MRRTVVDSVDCRDITAHGLHDTGRHLVADISLYNSASVLSRDCRYPPVHYLSRSLETRYNSRVTLTWLATASTRVSGTRASEAMAVIFKLHFSLANTRREDQVRRAGRGEYIVISYLKFHAR